MEPLPLETIPLNTDIETLIHGYKELIQDGFFKSFQESYDTLFISDYSPNENPLDNNVQFKISIL